MSQTQATEHTSRPGDTETTTVWPEGKKENTRPRRESALAAVVQSGSIHNVDCDVCTPTLTVSRGCAWMCTTTGILPAVFVLLTLERNEVLYSLSPPLVVPPWPVLAVCDHGQGVALPDRLTHTASSFFTKRPHSLSWTARNRQA